MADLVHVHYSSYVRLYVRTLLNGCYNVLAAIALLLLSMNATIREAIQTIALTAFAFLLLQATVRTYQVKGPSMDPQLINDQLVVVNKMIYMNIDKANIARYLPWMEAEDGEKWFPFHPPQRGDVVVFKNPKKPGAPDFVKRIIGEPGDRIEILAGRIRINGEVLDEPYVEHWSRETSAAILVQPHEYFVLGDNRRRSEDSRVFGLISRDEIVGEVWFGYWPLNQFGPL